MHTETKSTSRRLHVAFVTSIFPNPVEPTLGTFHGQLSRELRETCDLRVLTPQPWFPAAPQMPQLERWQRFSRIPSEYSVEGVCTLSPKYLMVPGISEVVRPWLMYPDLLRVAARLHRTKPIDVINGLWLYPDGVAAAKIARRLDVPLVLTGLGCDVNICLDEPLKRPQIVAAAQQAHSLIVVSEPLKQRLVAEGVAEEKITVITNGVDTATFAIRERRACAEALSLPDGYRRCLYVGRLAEEKGVLSLVAAMAILRRQRSDVKLYVVGDGSERPKAEQLVADNGLNDDVVFLGSRDHQQVASWIGASDLLCLPSLREGCPNVVLEALASGRPVVGTKVGGVPDLIDSRNGRLVPPQQPEALSAALNEVLNIDWDSAAIRRSVEDRSWRRAAGAYERVFRSAHDEAMTLTGEAV